MEPTLRAHHRLIDLIQRNELFSRMVRHQGLDLSGTWWRGLEYAIGRALARCARRAQPQGCRTWLDEPHAIGAYPAFCSNTTMIEACRIMDPSAPPVEPVDAVAVPELEAGLAEILDDPLIQRVMAADGIDSKLLYRELRQALVSQGANIPES